MTNETLYAPVGGVVHAVPLTADDVTKLQAAMPAQFPYTTAGDHLVVYPSGHVQTLPPDAFANHFTPANGGGFDWRDALKDVGYDAIRGIVVDVLERFIPSSGSSSAPAPTPAPAAASSSTDPNDRGPVASS